MAIYTSKKPVTPNIKFPLSNQKGVLNIFLYNKTMGRLRNSLIYLI